MWPSANLKTSGRKPSDRFVTTYSSNYKPFSRRPLPTRKPKTEAKAALASPNLLKTKKETWPMLDQLFYKTTNSTYGSYAYLQPPPSHLFSATSNPYSLVTPSISGSTKHEVKVVLESGYLVCEERSGQLHCVSSGMGMNGFSFFLDPARCEDFFRSLCTEAKLLNLPVTSGLTDTNKDAECLDCSSYLRGLIPAIGQKNCVFLQPPSSQCSCCAWGTVCPKCCCFKMQTFCHHTPQGRNMPLAGIQRNVHCKEPSRNRIPIQSSYGADWAQTGIQIGYFYHPPCH